MVFVCFRVFCGLLSNLEVASMDEQIEDSSEEWISKSQRKRDSKEIHKFVEALAKAPKGEYSDLELPEDIHDELEHAIAIKSPIGRARQLKYVAKLIRNEGIFPELKVWASSSKSRKKHFC